MGLGGRPVTDGLDGRLEDGVAGCEDPSTSIVVVFLRSMQRGRKGFEGCSDPHIPYDLGGACDVVVDVSNSGGPEGPLHVGDKDLSQCHVGSKFGSGYAEESLAGFRAEVRAKVEDGCQEAIHLRP